MRWFGTVYTPMMAVLGLLFIVLSFFDHDNKTNATAMMNAGAILAAGACISGAIRNQDGGTDSDG